MKPLLLATKNPGKAKEFGLLLGPTYLLSVGDAKAPQVIEDGKTYRDNALKKATAYWDQYKTPVLSDDSGLEIDALDGQPGVDSAVFGGEAISWPERWDFLYVSLKKTGIQGPWPARFRCVLCYLDSRERPLFFEATCEGKIVLSPQGARGFGYDPLFWSADLGRTFGEATASDKDRVSHRAKACKAFLSSA